MSADETARTTAQAAPAAPPSQAGQGAALATAARDVSMVVVPSVAMVAMRVFGAGDPAGTYRRLLLGLVVATGVGAFGTPTLRALLVRVPGLAVVAGGVHALLGGSPASVGAVAFLCFAVATAAAGLSALSRRIRVPVIPGAAVAALVVWTAMAGLTWADPVAGWIPRTERRAFRQAVLHIDPALAVAYDGAGFDRLRAPDVYFTVPLASSLFERPHAVSTGALWLVVGLVAAGGGKWGRRHSTAG